MFVQAHCIREAYPNSTDRSTVELAYTRQWERDWYTGQEYELLLEAADHLLALDPNFQVHCVYGTRKDFMCVSMRLPRCCDADIANILFISPQSCHDSILANRRMASVQFVENAGHAVIIAFSIFPLTLSKIRRRLLRKVRMGWHLVFARSWGTFSG